MSVLHIHRAFSHHSFLFFVFFFNDTATTEIYTLSLHDALPICYVQFGSDMLSPHRQDWIVFRNGTIVSFKYRSEEHTSELQSRGHLVCRLLLEKKKRKDKK